MDIVLYELVGRFDRRLSPYCWRTRIALAHKGLRFETRPTRFTEISGICGGGHSTVPVLQDGDRVVGDSFRIANYLDRAYPDRPSLFVDSGGLDLALFLHHWTFRTLHPRIFALIVFDLLEALAEEDRGYFRHSREKRYGRSLEEIASESGAGLKSLRHSLQPARDMLEDRMYFGGDRPSYAYYVLFGSLQWPRLCSPVRLLEDDDPVNAWFERCLCLADRTHRLAGE